MGLSAKGLGEKIGLTPEQTNTLLREEGFQIGQPGDYSATEKGKKRPTYFTIKDKNIMVYTIKF